MAEQGTLVKEYETPLLGRQCLKSPPCCLPAVQRASVKWSGDIKSGVTPGTVGRRADKQMSHRDWATLWYLKVMGVSVAALESALHLVTAVPNRLRQVWPWGLQEELWLLHATSETDEMRTGSQHLPTLSMTPLGIWIQVFRASSWCPSLPDYSSCLSGSASSPGCLSSAKKEDFSTATSAQVFSTRTWRTLSQQLTLTSGAREAQAALEDGSGDPVMIAALNYQFTDCKES